MCYASPGPRCFTHAKEDAAKIKVKLDGTQAKLDKHLENARAWQADHDRIAGKSDAVASTVKFYAKNARQEERAAEKLKPKVADLAQKHKAAEQEAYATKGGIEELEDRIAEQQNRGYGAEFLQDELRKARNTYDLRMEKYDDRNQTVYGRKPSPYGDDEGIDTLRGRLKNSEKKLTNLYRDALVNNVDNKDKVEKATEENRRIRNQLSHAYATDRHRKAGIIHDPKEAEAAEARARKSFKNAQESWERSDTDGFVSQWASGVRAEHHRMEAELIRKGGKAEFSALFDKDGNMVPAKRVTMQDRFNPGRMKTAWAVLSDPSDPSSPVKEWINESSSNNLKTQEAYLAKKGYTMGTVRVPAYVADRGDGINVRSGYERKDRGFSADAEVITKNRYPSLIKHFAKVDAENARLSGERARAEQARREAAVKDKKDAESK